MAWTLAELASWVGGRLVGAQPDVVIRGIAPLDEAGPEDLSFLLDRRYLGAARKTRAAAILCQPVWPDLEGPRLEVGEARQALAVLLSRCFSEPEPEWGVHETAVVGEGTVLPARVSLGPYAVVGRGVQVGEEVVIGAHAVIGDGCEIGAGAWIGPHVVLYRRTRVLERAFVHAGSVLGAPGFGYVEEAPHRWKHVPQVGNVEVGAEAEIGALVAVDRALVGSTRVGAGTKIDNLVQVGHNVQIGAGSLLCGQAGVAGSARLGKGVVVAGQAGVGGHLFVGDGARIAAKSAVFGNVPAKTDVAGIPARPIGEWRRQVVVLQRIANLWKKLQLLMKESEKRES